MNDAIGKSNHVDEAPSPSADCIICAAGASRRMGEWKLRLPWPRRAFSGTVEPSGSGEPWLVEAAVSAALRGGCRVILVTGYRGDELEARFSSWPGVVMVRNGQWKTGMVSSVKAGLSLVRSPWFFVAHGDMPLVGAHWYRKLLAALPPDANSDRPLALRPLYRGQPGQSGQSGHPVLFSRSTIPLIQAVPEGDSLKAVLGHCDLISIETGDRAIIHDVDTLESYINALVFAEGSREIAKLVTLPASESRETAVLSVKPSVISAILITGPQGAGKTSLLRRNAFQAFINLLEQESSRRSLFVMISQVQTGRGADGKALGFDIEAFCPSPEGELRLFRKALCRTAEATERDFLPPKDGSVSFPVAEPFVLGPYRFDPGAFESLARWLAPVLREQYDSIQVFIDELGRLELDKKNGLWPLYQALLRAIAESPGADKRHLVCTVRLDRSEKLAGYLRSLGFTVDLWLQEPL